MKSIIPIRNSDNRQVAQYDENTKSIIIKLKDRLTTIRILFDGTLKVINTTTK